MSKTLLAIGAHSADFAWRAAGTIAVGRCFRCLDLGDYPLNITDEGG